MYRRRRTGCFSELSKWNLRLSGYQKTSSKSISLWLEGTYGPSGSAIRVTLARTKLHPQLVRRIKLTYHCDRCWQWSYKLSACFCGFLCCSKKKEVSIRYDEGCKC